jgi:hypothetical protein
MDKKSFMNLEITLFLKNKNWDFKSPILKNQIKQIISAVYFDDLYNCIYFDLHKTKSEKVKE